jgi:hypothetical protein
LYDSRKFRSEITYGFLEERIHMKIPAKANAHIERKLDECVGELEKTLNSDILVLVSDLIMGVDDAVRDIVEEKRSQDPKRDKLTVIVTTSGGYIEIVHRIVDTLRHHYKFIEFIIPNYAYSAGTVFVMSGDEIYMDYYSRLGPIDPQVNNLEGRQVPALGYLKQWERLLEKAKNGNITLAEIQVMIQRFDQAELYEYEQARELSVSLLQEWLARYKFKNWKITATRRKIVTPFMRKQRAKQIATQLNDTDTWHSHGYGISMDVLNQKLKLLIIDFGKNATLNEQIREYHDLLEDYMTKNQEQDIIHIKGHYHPLQLRGEENDENN